MMSDRDSYGQGGQSFYGSGGSDFGYGKPRNAPLGLKESELVLVICGYFAGLVLGAIIVVEWML